MRGYAAFVIRDGLVRIESDVLRKGANKPAIENSTRQQVEFFVFDRLRNRVLMRVSFAI